MGLVEKMTKFFKFTATIEIWADDQQEANKIMNKIKDKGEFPDGSIIDSDFNIQAYRKI